MWCLLFVFSGRSVDDLWWTNEKIFRILLKDGLHITSLSCVCSAYVHKEKITWQVFLLSTFSFGHFFDVRILLGKRYWVLVSSFDILLIICPVLGWLCIRSFVCVSTSFVSDLVDNTNCACFNCVFLRYFLCNFWHVGRLRWSVRVSFLWKNAWIRFSSLDVFWKWRGN